MVGYEYITYLEGRQISVKLFGITVRGPAVEGRHMNIELTRMSAFFLVFLVYRGVFGLCRHLTRLETLPGVGKQVYCGNL